MDTFSIREHTGDLIWDVEKGKLSLVTKRGQPVFLVVPFTQELIELGLCPMLAINLYKETALSLAKAAKLLNQSIADFIQTLAKLDIPVVDYSIDEVIEELKDFE